MDAHSLDFLSNILKSNVPRGAHTGTLFFHIVARDFLQVVKNLVDVANLQSKLLKEETEI